MSGIPRFLRRQFADGKNSNPGHKGETPNKSLFSALRVFSSSDSSPEERKDKDEQKKVKSLQKRITEAGITSLGEENIKYALQSSHAQGDVEKAFDILLIADDSIEGIVRGYSPKVKLLGAENRQKVTCYLDALLFAMFARLDCFEAILYNTYSDEPRRKLSILLRLWVNMLRSGKLITTDITKHLQDALAECGWEDAAKIRQQDASEAFNFITEKLELPLLTLKMDIYHTGKEDAADDHKFVNERLLEVAIPHDTGDGKPVTLEDCLESYFNNKIEVKRHLERSNTISSVRSFDSTSKGGVTQIETVELGSSAPLSPVTSTSQRSEDRPLPVSSLTEFCESPVSATDSHSRRRSSIIRQRFIPDPDNDSNSDSDLNPLHSQPRKGAYRKEVMMPAWQFFSLIPWYTDIDNTQPDDAQIAAHFSTKRPIVGVCLKRYSMSKNGKAIRLKTRVDIPTEIGLPHFIQDNDVNSDGPICGNFKLSLQAFVCHRGKSVDSGHYIAIVRGTSAGAAPAVSNSTIKPSDDPSRYWMRFDDLAQERVTLVDVEKALETESPYLLFYQILPIDEDAAKANLKHKHTSSFSSTSNPDRDLDTAGASQSSNNLSAGSRDAEHTEGSASTRPSFEITVPDNSEPLPPTGNGKRTSTFSNAAESTNSDNKLQVTAATLAPSGQTPNDEGGRNSFSFSVRESRTFKKAPGSRDGSQASENRFSTAFSRFTGLLGRDKSSDELFNADGGDVCAVENGGARPMSKETEKEDRSTSRRLSKERGKSKDKRKERSRDKRGKKPDRECIVM